MPKISNCNFNLVWAPLFWSLVCARSLERRWRRLSNKQGHSKHAATKMEKTPHFAHWASAANMVKKHPLCVNPDFELYGLNASINTTTFWVFGFRGSSGNPHQSLQLFSSKSVKLPHKEGFFTKFAALAQCARSTVVSPTNRDRLREEAKVVLKRRCCCWLGSKTENNQLEKKSARTKVYSAKF